MARSYGNTKISSPRTISRKPQPFRPIIDEENPMPDKYEGDIIFNKTIYSKPDFENKIDIDFNELITDQPIVSIEELNRRVIEAESRLIGLQTAQEEEEATEAADNAAYEAEYGVEFATNPQLKYGKLKENLKILDSRGELRKSLNKNEKDLRQAKEKEDNNVSKKSYNQWNTSIDKRAEGKVKDDLRDLISQTRASIAAGNGWQI